MGANASVLAFICASKLTSVVLAGCFLAATACEDGHEVTAAADTGIPDAESASADAALDPDLGPVPAPAPLVGPDEALTLVDPFIGTGGFGFGYAAMTPAAQVPLGMVRLGPDTTRAGAHPKLWHFSGYFHGDPDVRGFSHTHFVGTGAADYGNVRVLPYGALPLDADLGALFVPIDKAAEAASPGEYAVRLLTGDGDPLVDVALAASTRGGVHRYDFAPGDGPRHLLFDLAASVGDEGVLDAEVRIDGGALTGRVRYDGPFVGRRQPFDLWVSATIDPPPDRAWVWDAEGERLDENEARGEKAGAVLAWDASGRVELRVALSYVDADHAAANRADGLDDRSFEEVRDAARAMWKDKLGRVRIAGGTHVDRRIFYTAQYHAYVMPTRLDEFGGQYRGFDAEVHDADGFRYYTDMSLWDTFRTLHPWYVLTDPDVQRDCLRSLLAMGEQGGYIPAWPAALSYTGSMIGTSADFLFAGSAVKGIDGVDYEAAYDRLMLTALAPVPPGAPFRGRSDIADYLELGYVAADRHSHSVSKTLEYVYADAALAGLAVRLDRPEAERLAERGRGYAALWDPETAFFQPRRADGTFARAASLTQVQMSGGDYTEGSPWHWRFYAPHDPEGLAALFGGQEALATALDAFFAESGLGRAMPVNKTVPDAHYWHGNEPAIHSAYLFWAADRSDRLAHWVRQIQTRLYSDGLDGIPGNDDGGTLSAWYLFSALGVMPIAGTDRYHLGPPLFPRAELDVGDGTILRIEAPDASRHVAQIRAIRLDGSPVDGGMLRHADLMGGATLEFDLDP